MKMFVETLLKYLILQILFSCNSQSTYEHKYLEIRNSEINSPKSKIDSYFYNTKGNIEYTSILKDDNDFVRHWIFPNPNTEIGESIEAENKEGLYQSKLIDKKIIFVDDNNYELIKYNIDYVFSSDEESNKIFVKGFGVIIETFWKRNKLTVIEMEPSAKFEDTLLELVMKAEKDKQFIWNQIDKSN